MRTGRDTGRGTAIGVILLAVPLLALVWAGWRFGTEGDQRDAVHVFQYCLLLILAAFVGSAIRARSGYVFLALAVIGTALPWVGLASATVVAVLVGLVAVVSGAYWLVRRDSCAATTTVLAGVVSLLGLLLIL